MSTIPPILTRVPELLRSQLSLASIQRTNVGLLSTGQQLATGVAFSRPSEDPIAAALVTVLDASLERAAQLARNLDVAGSSLATIDSALGEASDLLLEARSIGLSQVGSLADADERAAMAGVIDSILAGMLGVANRSSQVGSVFAGSTPGAAAVEAFGAGYRYLGSGPGLTTDLGAIDVPVTLGAGSVLGAVSARVEGFADLSPALTEETRLADVRGARGLGVTLGPVELLLEGGPSVRVDLTTADTIGDVARRIEAALLDLEAQTGQPLLGPGGVGVDASGLTIDLDAITAPAVRFVEVGSGSTAQDLGLAGDPPIAFATGASEGLSLSPRLTWTSPITLPTGEALGRLRIDAGGRTAVIDLSAAETIQDVRTAIEASGLGLRVELNAERTGINVLYEVAGGSGSALSISEIAGEGGTAALLGIRTLSGATPTSVLNDGRGVGVVSGQLDPDTGLLSSTLNTDFDITLGNGLELAIDLQPEDLVSVGAVLTAINAQAQQQLAAAGLPAIAFEARLLDGANGIALVQDAALGTTLTVTQRNNSTAAFDLGLLGGALDASTGVYLGSDPATVRVDNVFTHLIDLRDALLAGNTFGIGLATEALAVDLDRVAETRGLVGGRARIVDQEFDMLDQRRTLDETTRSHLRDTDFAEAASRYSLLQSQLQASLQVAASANSLSLLDFLI